MQWTVNNLEDLLTQCSCSLGTHDYFICTVTGKWKQDPRELTQGCTHCSRNEFHFIISYRKNMFTKKTKKGKEFPSVSTNLWRLCFSFLWNRVNIFYFRKVHEAIHNENVIWSVFIENSSDGLKFDCAVKAWANYCYCQWPWFRKAPNRCWMLNLNFLDVSFETRHRNCAGFTTAIWNVAMTVFKISLVLGYL